MRSETSISVIVIEIGHGRHDVHGDVHGDGHGDDDGRGDGRGDIDYHSGSDRDSEDIDNNSAVIIASDCVSDSDIDISSDSDIDSYGECDGECDGDGGDSDSILFLSVHHYHVVNLYCGELMMEILQ